MPIAEKKIFLDKIHDLEYVVSKVIESEADKVILNIPRDSAFGRIINNFQVLKREADTAGKEIFIESVDDHILELASIVGMESQNPVFKNSERAVSDILPRSSFKKRISEVKESFEREVLPEVKIKVKSQKTSLSSAKENPTHKKIDTDLAQSQSASPVFSPVEVEDEPAPKRSRSLKKTLVLLVIILVLVGVGYTAVRAMPKASVHITLKKTLVDFKEAIEVGSKVREVDVSGARILVPGELLVAEKNINRAFKASSKERVEAKAVGRLWVYNGYSSQPQTLVIQTRFESPDKHIFRLTKQVTIPGAKIDNGKIIPSKIEVSVVADGTGAEFNLAPTTGWKIPGFKGSPRYEGFYAESVEPMTGGFVGERAAPTADDLKKARSELEASLKDALKNEMSVLTSDKFMFFEDAEVFKNLEEKKDVTSSESPDVFNLFLRGELRGIIFDKLALEDAVALKSRRGLPEGLRYRDLKLDYGPRDFDFTLGRIRFEAKGSLAFQNDIKVDEVKREIIGKDEKSLQSLVFALPGLEKATISLWPFWVRQVPENEKKIKVEID